MEKKSFFKNCLIILILAMLLALIEILISCSSSLCPAYTHQNTWLQDYKAIKTK
jgi:hypothetical protein